jgi:hypothetical protein
MRTTIDLDEDVLRTAKALAAARKVTLSRVISDLAKKGMEPEPIQYTYRNGFPVFPKRPGAQPVTSEHVKELLERADLEETDL